MNDMDRLYFEDELWRRREPDTSGMIMPVRCNRCGGVYDLCGGEIVARYLDCTVYVTPCCKQTVDDRPRGLVSYPAFERL